MLQKIVFLFALYFSSFAQIRVLNEQNLQPIEGVEVYSNKGILVGLSDVNGYVQLNSSDSFYFSHFLYECKTSQPTPQVYLKPRSIQLADVQVNPISENGSFIERLFP